MLITSSGYDPRYSGPCIEWASLEDCMDVSLLLQSVPCILTDKDEMLRHVECVTKFTDLLAWIHSTLITVCVKLSYTVGIGGPG